MYIEAILRQNRRDFTARYKCEHCGTEHEGYGYDDTHFHVNVVPAMLCKNCGKAAKDNSKVLNPKYPDYVAL